MKHRSKKTFLISLILSVILTGCSFFPQPPFEEKITEWSPDQSYYGSELVFQLVSQPDYVKETTVYQVGSEMELALLAKILFDQDVLMFYITDTDYSINKIYTYLDALMIHAFKFSMGTKTYTKNDTIVKTLDYVKIELYADHRPEVNTALNDFLSSRVNTTDPIKTQLKAIHDGLVLSTQYDTAVLDIDLNNIVDHTPFEAYGLLINHKAVCSGYAKSFMGLAQELQIPVLTVSSQAMNHAWNLVYDGTAWLYVDATFDDPVPDKAGRVLQTYFLIDKKKITTASSTIKAHVFDESSDNALSAQDYMDFAAYLFPSTQP
jgi:hypothetical protein